MNNMYRRGIYIPKRDSMGFGEWQSWIGPDIEDLPIYDKKSAHKIDDLKEILLRIGAKKYSETEIGKQILDSSKKYGSYDLELKLLSNKYLIELKDLTFDFTFDADNLIISGWVNKDSFRNMKYFSDTIRKFNTGFYINNFTIYTNQKLVYSHVKIGGGFEPYVTGAIIVQRITDENDYKLSDVIAYDSSLNNKIMTEYSNFLYNTLDYHLKVKGISLGLKTFI